MEKNKATPTSTAEDTQLFRLPPYVFWKNVVFQTIQLVIGYYFGWGLTNSDGGFWANGIRHYFKLQSANPDILSQWTYFTMIPVLLLVLLITIVMLVLRKNLWKVGGLLIGLLYGAYHHCEVSNYIDYFGGGQG